MDHAQLQIKSTLHPHHFLPDKIIFGPKVAAAMKGRCGLVKTIPHGL
jgi:hypothetical protein